jgi:dolichyl-phosphate-mannose-protein mannosyltransferase
MLAILSALIPLTVHKRPNLFPDSFQYLTAANSIHSTGRMATSLVHFDTERSHGTIPAPLTWFPPGYPLAITAVSQLGCSPETAALLISVASFVFVAWALWRLVRIIDPSVWTARVAVLCWIVSSQALFYSVSALSEAIFTVLGLASVLFLVSAEEMTDSVHVWICWLGSAVMAGLSYWVRYAGILWVLGCVAFFMAQIVYGNNGKRSRLPAIAATALLLLLVAPLMIRNVMLVGDWRGGNNTPAAMPLGKFAVDSAKLTFHLVLGDAPIGQLALPAILIAIGVIGVCVVARHFLRTGVSWRLLLTKQEIVLAAFLLYSGGIAGIALRSVIEYAPRMFIPVLPHLIVLATCFVAFVLRHPSARNYPRWVPLTIVLCLLLGYTVGNLFSRALPEPDTFEKTEEALRQPDRTGRSVKDLLGRELEPNEVIASTNGQAAGYILAHPTLSLVGYPYDLTPWSEPVLHKQIDRFGARHLLVFRDITFDPVIRESRFLGALAACRPAAPWLQLVNENPSICVYRVE